MPAPTDPRKIDRFAELVGGAPCNQAEAARAAGISEPTGDRLLRRPEVKAKIEDARRRNALLVKEAQTVIESMLQAENQDGTPDVAQRAKGVELALRYKEQLEADTVDDIADALPAGAWVVYPTRWED